MSQNTDALLGINPESIVIKTGINSMVGPGSIISIKSILTDDLANEYNRLQNQLNLHRKVAGVEVREFDKVSIASGLNANLHQKLTRKWKYDLDINSIRTDMIHKEFLTILQQRQPMESSQRSEHLSESSRATSNTGRTSQTCTAASESSRQSTVKSRATNRSRRSGSVKRIVDPNLEQEKVRAELNLLYLEKREAEQELGAIRDEIQRKESLARASTVGSARLEALEISSRVNTAGIYAS